MLFATIIITTKTSYSQDEQKKLIVNGYISNLQSAMFDSIQKNWTIDNLIHNRINLKWYAPSNLTLVFEMRNRFVYGESLEAGLNNPASYEKDYGFIDLTKNIVTGNSYLLNLNIDRLNLTYEKDKFRVTLGRQRINWSQTLVWNPNDIFNTYSFFDFDYIERPGSDALRIQYYNTEVSSSELAIKMNSEKQVTAAAFYKFNVFEYDFQILGGVLNSEDYVIGTGWSGAIRSISFRGEFSYFHPKMNYPGSRDVILASIGFDYTFGNSFMLGADYLYCGNNINDSLSFIGYYNAPQTVKNLSIVKHNILIQASYPITPLLTGNIAGMYLPGIKGYYLSPSFNYSIYQNFDVSFYYQAFGGEIQGNHQRINLAFLRIKFSF